MQNYKYFLVISKHMPNHVGVVANLTATAVFFAPNLLFYAIGLYWLLLLYNLVIILLLVIAVSNIKYKAEIEGENEKIRAKFRL